MVYCVRHQIFGNTSLSPWKAPAVFGNEDFGDGAEETLGELKKLLDDPAKKYYLCGYSMAGLFALWADSRLDGISGVAAVSPSVCEPEVPVRFGGGL